MDANPCLRNRFPTAFHGAVDSTFPLFPIVLAAVVFSVAWLVLAFLVPERSMRLIAALIALVPVPTAILYLAMFHGLGAPGVSSPWLNRACIYIAVDGGVIFALGVIAMLRK